jgi:DNA-binding phage protein
MRKTKTTRYDVAEHLRTPEEMAAYLEACLDEARVTQRLSPRHWAILHARGAWGRRLVMPAYLAKVFTKRSPVNVVPTSIQSSRW